AQPSESTSPSSSSSTGPSGSSSTVPSTSGSPDGDRDDLAQTGFNARWLGLSAGVIVVLGLGLVLVRSLSRRRSH
ncbi:hypothetical protein, partial [Glutamicibacter arilaitensis]|uniref:hypothetical protein n=1 Tax=Glutamicibacter arilaitensis TaxID=256701 RepID=UPI003FD08E05